MGGTRSSTSGRYHPERQTYKRPCQSEPKQISGLVSADHRLSSRGRDFEHNVPTTIRRPGKKLLREVGGLTEPIWQVGTWSSPEPARDSVDATTMKRSRILEEDVPEAKVSFCEFLALFGPSSLAAHRGFNEAHQGAYKLC